jgi:hypothetical protein
MTAPPVPPRAHSRDPALLAVVAACLVAALVLVGLPLAYVGGFYLPIVLAAGVALTVGLVWLLEPGRRGLSGAAGAARWWLAAYVLAAASALVNGRLASEHSIADRDPGVYAMTARWLVRHHDLTLTPPAGPFAGQLSAGLTPGSDGSLQFQFVHGLPVLQAMGDWALGENGLYRLPPALAALALLAVFGLALELLPPAWAFAATALLAISLPFVYVARDGFSEPLMLVMLATGAWMFLSALRVSSWQRAALAGALLGVAACARIDFPVYALPLALVILWVGTLPGNGESDSWWRAGGRRALLAGLVPGVVIGLLDVIDRSHAYFLAQRASLVQVALVTAAVVVASVVVTRRRTVARRIREVWEHHRGRVAAGALGLLLTAAALAIALPLLQTARNAALMLPRAGIFEPLQRADGVRPVDPARTFYEHAGHWIAWHDGWPVLMFAVAGAALLLWRVVHGEARAAEGLMLAFAAVPLTLIVARPSIYPDQPWAARRLVPFALPGALLLATTAVAWAVDRCRAYGSWAPRAALAVGLLALFVPAAATTGRVARFQEYAGMQRPIDAVCSAVPRDAALLVLNETNLPIVLPGALTAWCGVPASGAPAGVGVPAMTAAWRARGRDLWAVAATEATLRTAGFTPVARGRTVMRRVLRKRLLGAPAATDAQIYELVVGRRARH